MANLHSHCTVYLSRPLLKTHYVPGSRVQSAEAPCSGFIFQCGTQASKGRVTIFVMNVDRGAWPGWSEPEGELAGDARAVCKGKGCRQLGRLRNRSQGKSFLKFKAKREEF